MINTPPEVIIGTFDKIAGEGLNIQNKFYERIIESSVVFNGDREMKLQLLAIPIGDEFERISLKHQKHRIKLVTRSVLILYKNVLLIS
jgi:hypothetical protein